ncbi:MAG: hypothetical protein HAW60_02090 [Bdellovibrionales bacterium]|nr:hypothetical protein [Bdellovibrionales bacterium]
MSLKILLIDNSHAIKKVFAISLKGYDYDLKFTDNTNEALNIIKNFKPEIIFIDSLDQDLKISEFIKKCNEDTKSHIVLLKNSALKNTESIKTLIKSKAIKNVLEKPFNKQDLREIIHPYVYNENNDDSLDTPVTLDPVVKWENNIDVEKSEILDKNLDKTKNTDKQEEKLSITTEALQKIVLEQLNYFFKDKSKKIIEELATPIIQEYVQEKVKNLAKNIIEQEIQKMLNQQDAPSKLKQI